MFSGFVLITSMMATTYSAYPTPSYQNSYGNLAKGIDFILKDKLKENNLFKYGKARQRRQILSPAQIQAELKKTAPFGEKEREEMMMTTEDVDRVDPSIQILWETLVNSDSEITGLEVKEPPELEGN